MGSLNLSSPHILIFERDQSMQSLLAEVLSEVDYTLSFSSSLEETMDLLTEETFALVLADVYVGIHHAGSFTPAHILRRRAHPTPVGLLMTAPFTAEEARHAGFAFVLPMPFDLEMLLADVAHAIQQPFSEEQQQQIQVVERYFAAREQGDWQTMMDLCTKDIAFSPLGSGDRVARLVRGETALQGFFVAEARSVRFLTFLHPYYAALPKGLVVRYVRLWTTPEGERRREAKIAFFHFRGEQIAQIGRRPLLSQLGRGEAQAG